MFGQMFELSILFHLAAKLSTDSSGGAVLVRLGQHAEVEPRIVAKKSFQHLSQKKKGFVGVVGPAAPQACWMDVGSNSEGIR